MYKLYHIQKCEKADWAMIRSVSEFDDISTYFDGYDKRMLAWLKPYVLRFQSNPLTRGVLLGIALLPALLNAFLILELSTTGYLSDSISIEKLAGGLVVLSVVQSLIWLMLPIRGWIKLTIALTTGFLFLVVT